MNWTTQELATANTFIQNRVVPALIKGKAKGTKTVKVNICRGYPLHIIKVAADILNTEYQRKAYTEYTWLKIDL